MTDVTMNTPSGRYRITSNGDHTSLYIWSTSEKDPTGFWRYLGTSIDLGSFFSVPSLDEMLHHVNSEIPIPFTHFGLSGGFGTVRTHLVKSIREGRYDDARRHYYELIEESIQEGIDEHGLSRSKSIEHLQENVDSLGQLQVPLY